jgi:nitronate monooxygenase
LPIIQGGMGVGVSLSGLAAAIANEGGVGVIACAGIGMIEPDLFQNFEAANLRALRKEIRRAREASKGILGVNIMVALSNFTDLVKTALDEGIDLIFSGAGLPLDLPRYRRGGDRTRLVPIVSSGRAAKIIAKRWMERYDYPPDAVVVEGPRAGGHLGFKPEQIADPTYALERLLAEVLVEIKPFETKAGRPIPVVPGGGIYTGADLHRFLQLGAAGVQMATRFVTTHECDASLAFKEAYLRASPEDLIIICSPVGMPGRAIRNQFLEDVKAGKRMPFTCPYHCIVTCDYTNSPYCIALALINAQRGRMNHGFAFAGENAHRATEIVSVKALVQTLLAEYRAASG